MAGDLRAVAAERIRDELVKLLSAADPLAGLRLLVDTGLAEHVLPELPALRLEIDEHHQHKDVYEHSLTVERRSRGGLEAATGRTWCCGWPRCCTTSASRATRRFEPGGGVSFHHHEVVGAKLTRQAAEGAALRQGHHRRGGPRWSSCTCASTATATGEWTDSAVRRYVDRRRSAAAAGCTS